jgi:predicted dinucleotide-binding enzyme
MRIGILGSRLMGGKLGTLFARAGHEVVFSYARSEQKLKRLAREARGNARAGTPADGSRPGARVPLRAIREVGARHAASLAPSRDDPGSRPEPNAAF